MLFELAFALALHTQPVQALEATPAVKENLSQLIRSNAGHYWSYVKKDTLAPFSKYEGLVAGDPHLGNFSVIPVETIKGQRELRFLNIDFDDAGVGSLALDFARLVITVKAANDDVKIPDLVNAYVDGLNGHEHEAPMRIRELTSMPMSKYDKNDDKYVDHKTTAGKFKMIPGEIEAYDAKYSVSAISRLFPHLKVLDLATRPQERGGSLGSLRVWVLLEDSNAKQSIYEIKGYTPTSMAKYKPQEAEQSLIKKVQAIFWPGLSSSTYDLQTLAGDLVWVRPKKVPLLEFKKSDTVFVEELAAYDANLLGLIHGAQSKAFVNAVNADTNAFKDSIKALKQDYISYAEKTLR